jgi:hypothetical protein
LALEKRYSKKNLAQTLKIIEDLAKKIGLTDEQLKKKIEKIT